MYSRLRLLSFLAGILLVGVIGISHAQDAVCDVDTSDVLNVVESVCTDIGPDQVCYGNFEVNLIAQDDAPDLVFRTPGDMTALGHVRSLFLSALDPVSDIWGIAQMRLFATTSQGAQDVTLLLFGDVTVESAVEPTTVIDVQVGRYAANVRNVPSTNSLVLASVPPNTIIEAVGRFEDTSWIRVRVPDSAAIGWVAAELVSPANVDDDLEMLEVQESDTPYFGPMQAFYYTSGSSSVCSNVVSDGLLIQTPEGVARVTLLINEVSIELIAGQNGATAFVQANPENGMTVSMIDGTAYVETAGTSFFVDSTMQTTIPMNAEMSPSGTPTIPQAYNVEAMQSLALLPVVRDPSQPIVSVSSTTVTSGSGGGGNTSGNANGRGRGNATGNATGNANGRGR